MPRPPGQRAPRVVAQSALSGECPESDLQRGVELHDSDMDTFSKPADIAGVLRDLERKHIESLEQIRQLARCMVVPESAEINAAQRPFPAGGDMHRIDAAQVGRTGSDMVSFRSRSRSGNIKRVPDANNDLGLAHLTARDSTIGDMLSGSSGKVVTTVDARCPWMSFKARIVLGSKMFDHGMGLVIFLNTCVLGIQAQQELEGRTTFVARAEHVFLAIYCVELVLRIIAYGFTCLRDGWVAFDATLVCLGVISEWLLAPVISSSDVDLPILKQVMVLRVLRLLRLLRALRMMETFRVAWKLAYGLLTSGTTIISVFGLLVLALYIFALAGVEVITKDSSLTSNPEVSSIIQQHFNSVPAILLSLSQFVLADSIASIYSPLITAKPGLVLYFVPIMLIISISLMNLVTAVIVEGALASAGRDKEIKSQDMKKRARSLASKFEDLFHTIDADGNGVVSIDEMRHLTVDQLPPDTRDCVDPDAIAELSRILDADGSGDVSQEEFVHGMIGLCMAEVPKEMLLTLKLARIQMQAALDMETRLDEIENNLLQALDNVHARSTLLTTTENAEP